MRPNISRQAIAEMQTAEQQQIEPEIVKTEEEKYISDSLLNEHDSKVRYSTAEWLKKVQQTHVTIIGIGGIGSWTAMSIARMSIGSIFCFDDDTVDAMNMAGQMYRLSDIGEKKTTAVNKIIKEYVPTLKGGFFCEKYSNQGLTPITITALDSMAARELVWQQYKRQFLSDLNRTNKECLFVDGRMAAEAFQVFAFRPRTKEDIERYENTLFSDSEARATECSYKATTFVGMGIAAIITAAVKEHIRIKDDTFFKENVKFFTEFDSTRGIHVNQADTWEKDNTIIQKDESNAS